jgi:hypothetical protein
LIRHQEYTRARLVQASERLRALVWPETRPLDELLVSSPVDRISFDPLELDGDEIVLPYRPHQLLTVKVS